MGGGNYYIAIFPPICQGENLLYSHVPAYPGKGGKWGENGSITPPGICYKLQNRKSCYTRNQ